MWSASRASAPPVPARRTPRLVRSTASAIPPARLSDPEGERADEMLSPAADLRGGEQRGGSRGLRLRILVQALAAVEAAGDLERLPLRTGRRRMRREVARCSDERECLVGRPAQELVLADGGLDALDRMEVAVLTEQARAQRSDQAIGIAARAE